MPIFIKSGSHPGINELEKTLQEGMNSKPSKSLQELADLLLEKGKQLAAERLLTFEKLSISLHKVKSQEWNVLLVKYRKSPYVLHLEVITIPEQIELKL